MTLTTAGKIALFANVGLSLMFAFWGFGIYSQRINWTDKKIGERDGQYALRAAEIKQLKGSRQRVDRRWQEATDVLQQLEGQRPAKQDWYKKQIDLLKTGDAKQRIQEIEFEQGQVKIDPKTGLPRMKLVSDQANKPIPGLASLPVLNDAYGRIQKNIVAVTEQINDLTGQEKQLTEQLGDGQAAGLRFDLAQQLIREKQSLDEQEYLQPLLYNSMVEQQSLEQRQRVLEDRAKQLRDSSVAQQP